MHRKKVFREQPGSIFTGPYPESLEDLAEKVKYSGSPYHKMKKWWGGLPQTREYPASICPEYLHEKRENIENWLKIGLKMGAVSKFHHNGLFPKRIWYKAGQTVFEAILENPTTGIYHGYPINEAEWPSGIEKIFENAGI